MKRRTFILAGLFAAFSDIASAEAYRALDWPQLLPKGEAEMLVKQKQLGLLRTGPHGSLEDTGRPMNELQFGTFKTVKALNGAMVKLRGFAVPLDFSGGRGKEFLLVPYYGACIHAPPPPPNQTVLVRSAKPIAFPSLSAALEISGKLSVSTNSSAMGDSAYQIELDHFQKIG